MEKEVRNVAWQAKNQATQASYFVAEWNVMADEQGNARQRNFDGIYFWGMIIAMFVSLAIFIILAFTSQVQIGHGQG
ncbi:hypothetical protein SAMN05444167_2676 [Terriglobus roseus]|uniref:Uncharacterized protein n=1 Tax=Terriglobus roseus TaxID=392734 RepID=A0A1G7M1T8_9BACT|nr:hypothetical protein SAMN05444167_2676 [Terriglobus roseus]